MALDPSLTIQDCAAIKVLIIPVGKITHEKFEQFKQLLLANSVIQLADLTRQSTAESTIQIVKEITV